MLDTILSFFDRRIAPGVRDGDHHSVALACCALLAEMVRVDAEVRPVERATLRKVAIEQFRLGEAEADELLALAEREAAEATDYFQFTSLINRHFDQAQKIALVEGLWRVALADDEISAHERHMMRKLESLLHITAADHIAARERAKAAGS